MVETISVVVLAYGLVYLAFTSIIAWGEKRLRLHVLPDELPRVSVVICARNEERNLPRCLEAFLALDYPRDRIEVFLVDDESEDGTRRIIEEYAARDGMFRLLTTAGEPRELPGKQRPLAMGIRHATGEFVLITDADIAIQPGWVKGHLRAFTDKVGIVGSSTRVDTSSGSLFDMVQNADLITKHAVAMGCAGLGLPLTVMGNNISFRKEAYTHVGGYEAMHVSLVEDMALMNAVVHKTPFTMTWAADPGAMVTSMPEPDFNTFVNQRLRWVFEVADLSLIGKLTLGMEIGMLAAFAASLAIAWWAPLPAMLLALSWFMGYALMLRSSQGYRPGDMRWIPAVLLFQPVYSAVLGWRKLFGGKKITWKGRTFNGPR